MQSPQQQQQLSSALGGSTSATLYYNSLGKRPCTFPHPLPAKYRPPLPLSAEADHLQPTNWLLVFASNWTS